MRPVVTRSSVVRPSGFQPLGFSNCLFNASLASLLRRSFEQADKRTGTAIKNANNFKRDTGHPNHPSCAEHTPNRYHKTTHLVFYPEV